MGSTVYEEDDTVSHRQPGLEEEAGRWVVEGDRKGQGVEVGTGGEDVDHSLLEVEDRSLLKVVEGGFDKVPVLHQQLVLG